jgi:hypothetical protein
VVKYLRTGAEAAGEPRPDARLLQAGLTQRIGGEPETTTSSHIHEQAEPAPPKRAAGSRLAEF